MKIRKFLLLSFLATAIKAHALPGDFVYLQDIDPSIVQEIRYASFHNFIGRPIKGYEAAECILTRSAALALKNVQRDLNKRGLGLKVYDCYRPQMAVNDFIAWSQIPDEQRMKTEFYPRVDKKDFFNLGYVAAKSGHTRGSTVDLTIISLPMHKQLAYNFSQKLVACFMPYDVRFQDNSIDMGTGFDCMDELAHAYNRDISKKAYDNRILLRETMWKYGFKPYNQEWWHFTLINEPFPNTYFNFPVHDK